jgi:DNA replication protein DnaC
MNAEALEERIKESKDNCNIPNEFKKHRDIIRDQKYLMTCTEAEKKDHIETIETLQDYINNIDDNIKNGISVLMYGQPGRRKTTFGNAILLSAAEKGYSVHYVKSSEISALRYFQH